MLELRHKLKQDAQTTSAPIDRIVEISYSDMITTQTITDSIVKFPTLKILKNTVSGKRGLIFASIDDIKYLAYQKFWYAECTFYTSPSIFYQIYSIHAFDEGLSTPCVYALLADKSEETYYDLFSTLIKKIIEISNMIKLEYITIDFEVAVKNVFYKHYPHIQVKGCLFHYGKALFRNFTKLNLKTPFQEDESLRNWFRSFAAIALLPETDMEEASQYLRTTKPLLYERQIDSFLEYHDRTYGIQSSFPPKMYNHYRNLNPRTINYLEERHNKWNKRAIKPHNDIYACIDMFKDEQLLVADERQRHEAGAPPPKRRRNTRIAEESLNRLWDKLQKNQISKETFLKGAGLRYFQYLKIE
ncbi:unnamed protein product [Rotaria socialis]|uniref:MULE transposase domain-containing protein n=1 Tax=Rotaria socialis TaxID=392032 RepID=A0A818UB93_9BILA|nr:unnamed protein product [Rotaria socialis]CAF3695450.1 unnamed protein product [Rotaria socialis]